MSTTETRASDPMLYAAMFEPDAPADPRWHRLAEGALSADEAASLHDEAQATAEGRLLWEHYQPLDAAEEARLLRVAAAQINAAEPGLVARLRAWWEALPGWGRWMPLGAGCAVAAAVLVLSAPRGGEPPAPVAVAWSHARGSAADRPPVLATPDAAFAATIVPEAGTKGPLVLRGGLLRGEGQVRPWAVRAEQAPEDGTIVLAGPKKQLFPCVPAGAWDVLVAVGRPGPALSQADLIRLAGQPAEGSVQVLQKRVVLGGPEVGPGGEPCRADER
jgi:hypothetical protein